MALPTIPGVDPEEDTTRLLAHLRSHVDGLDALEAARRLEQVGPNEIRRETGSPWWRSLLDQLIHPLALLLWVAAALALATGVLPLASAIVVVILLNAAFAFVQERQAEHATEALRELLPPSTRVRRGGAPVEIDAVALVPGDVLLLAEGDRLSADARLLVGAVELDMSPLTGESQPVTRTAERSRVREHPQVRYLHLRPRHAGDGAVPALCHVGRQHPAAAHGPADPGDRPRRGDPAGARAGT